jgi:hypothetical protein
VIDLQEMRSSFQVKEIRQEALLQVISASAKTTQKQTEISKRITGLRFQGSFSMALYIHGGKL